MQGGGRTSGETPAEALEARIKRLETPDAELIERPPPEASHHRRQGCRCSAYGQLSTAPRFEHYVANTVVCDRRAPWRHGSSSPQAQLQAAYPLSDSLETSHPARKIRVRQSVVGRPHTQSTQDRSVECP